MKYHSKHLGADVAGKEDALRDAPNPAAAEMITFLDESGVEIAFDRLEAQMPQCGYGLRGLCCRMCQWGPCRISDKSPRGVCGRGVELVVMANLLRAVAAGASAQTMHAREMILTLRAVARGELDLPIGSTLRLQEVGYALNVERSWWTQEQVAEAIAEVMLADLETMTGGSTGTLLFSPRERRKTWDELGIRPRGTAHEIIEALHMTTLGGCSDWEMLFRQALRTSLAYIYSGLVTSSVLADILYGIPEPRTVEVNVGVLKADHVNILLHGHSPVMLEKVLEKVSSEEIQALAREKGAAGIVVGGVCCTGHEALGRHGIPTVAGALSQELVLGTGAVDALVVDMQCVLPGTQTVAECFGTEIVTTYESNRVPGALHVPFDPEHPETLDEDALRIATAAVEAFPRRDRSEIRIPGHTTSITAGFSREAIMHAFGGWQHLFRRIRDGEIRGIVAMVGCTTPKVPHEADHVMIAQHLIEQGVLVLTSGCSAHALMAAGLCSTDALADAAPGLRAACEEADVPPVMVMGGCSDNARIVQIFAMLAHEENTPMPEMPFVVSLPGLTHEKPMGQLVGVLAHGISAVVGLTPALPIPTMGPRAEAAEAGAVPGHNPMYDFFSGGGLESLVGSNLYVRPDYNEAGPTIIGIIDEKREALGWDSAGDRGTPRAASDS